MAIIIKKGKKRKMKTVNTYRLLLKLLFITAVLSFCVNVSFAQFAPGLPDRAITSALPLQTINFGTFCLNGGSGGYITVGLSGSVSTTGGIFSFFDGRGAQPAIYAIKLCQGRRIKISFRTTYLICNGVQLELLSGPSEFEKKGEIFITNRDCDFVNPVCVGGKLKIPDNTPPGLYVGEMLIDLIQE